MSEQDRIRQISILSVALSEVLGIPILFGWVVYYLLDGKPGREVFTGVAATIGLGLGFYRLYQRAIQEQRNALKNSEEKNEADHESKNEPGP